MSAYDFIVNPETGRRVSIYNTTGRKVLKRYFQLGVKWPDINHHAQSAGSDGHGVPPDEWIDCNECGGDGEIEIDGESVICNVCNGTGGTQIQYEIVVQEDESDDSDVDPTTTPRKRT